MKKAVILITIFFLLFGIGTVWWKNGTSAVNKGDTTKKIFIIPPLQGVREIANNLKSQGLIKDPVVFFLLVKSMGLDGKIQAGDFRLSPSQNPREIAENLTHGTLDIWVTIPEGKRAAEIAEIFKNKIPTYNASWKNKLVEHEGYLFPDTYLIPKDADIDTVVNLMTNNFEQKFAALPKNKSGLTKVQVVILASMIEREAKLPEDRPLVASVMLNRLGIGMALQIDATVQYVLGYQEDEKTWWKQHLTKQDIAIDSSYNTYIYAQLPPGPISNPGLDTLTAVINPSETEYLYYISDKHGKNHYAKTIEEHNENIKKYGL